VLLFIINYPYKWRTNIFTRVLTHLPIQSLVIHTTNYFWHLYVRSRTNWMGFRFVETSLCVHHILSSCSHFGASGWFLSFMIVLQAVGLPGRVISSLARPLPKHRTTQTQINAYTHIKHPCLVFFEPTIQAFERKKIVHALDRSVTVTGMYGCFQ
jgi:hypothetical protein